MYQPTGSSGGGGALGELVEWKAACSRNNCSAGKLLTMTGNESTMKNTRQKLGPF